MWVRKTLTHCRPTMNWPRLSGHQCGEVSKQNKKPVKEQLKANLRHDSVIPLFGLCPEYSEYPIPHIIIEELLSWLLSYQ